MSVRSRQCRWWSLGWIPNKGNSQADSRFRETQSFIRTVAHDDGSEVAEWFPPELSLKWPAYFKPNETDAKERGERVRKDLQAGVITKRTAVEQMSRIYGIDDVEAYLEALEGEGVQRQSSIHQALANLENAQSQAEQADGQAPPQEQPPASES